MTVARGGWTVMVPDGRGDDERHVVAEQWSDQPMHVIEPTCWCQPRKDYEDVTGVVVWVHRRTLDGPVYEKEAS